MQQGGNERLVTGTVLVTGAGGFIGRNLLAFLKERGVRTAGLGHGQPPGSSKDGLDHWINGDVDHQNLQSMHNEVGPISHVFHLAGGAHVGRSYSSPGEDFHRTVLAGSNLFEWVRLNSPETGIVIASSAAVYGSAHTGPIPETAQLKPFSPYGAHKAMLEALAHSYCENFDLKVSICRLFSVYGPGLKKQLIYDLCVRSATAPKVLELGGSGTELRDWIHVDDVVRLLWMSREQASSSCFTVNGGTGAPVSVREVAELFVRLWGDPVDVEFNGEVRKGDPQSLVAATSRANEVLGFENAVAPEDGFADVISWFREAS